VATVGNGVGDKDGGLGKAEGDPVGEVDGAAVDVNMVAANTGCSVGDTVRGSVGDISVGWRVGYPVGAKVLVGELVSKRVGGFVWYTAGFGLGESEDTAVGSAVGETGTGIAVETAVGLAIGCAVDTLSKRRGSKISELNSMAEGRF
jgi:hypothetical protein